MDGTQRDVDLKARVLEATDIVALIQRTVKLQRRGKDHVGLCPFHQEKSPSFTVSQSKQFFHCYGCKKGGNAIDFVIERDRLSFVEAMKQLATAAGITVTAGSGPGPKASEIQLLRDAHTAASMFFEKQLAHPTAGAAAREYLATRGFNDDAIRHFHIGLALPSWDGFLSSPGAKKFAPGDLALAGLIKPRENGGGFYDTFRNRLIFPIRDPEGRVIAFGGRVMPGSEDPAKYLNSPQTPLFDKGRCAFGLDLAKEKILETKVAAVVEGYTDVVMAHQYGCTNVVSVLGTALTPRHLTTLARYADKIVLLFDPDTAGDKAVDRAVELFLTQDKVEIAVASLPDGLDPDEFLMKHGAAAFDGILSGSSDALTFKWRQLTGRFIERSNDLTGQQKAVDEYLAMLSAARQSGHVDSLRWGAALHRVSRLTGMPTDQLHRRLRVKTAKARPSTQAEQPQKTKTIFLTAKDRAESFIMGYLLCEPHEWLAVQAQISPEDFTQGPRRTLAEIYWRHQQDEGEPVLNQFLTLLDADPAVKELAAELAQGAQTPVEPREYLRSCLESLRLQQIRLEQERREARLRGGISPPLSEQDELDVLQQLSEFSKIPDPRRMPVRYGA